MKIVAVAKYIVAIDGNKIRVQTQDAEIVSEQETRSYNPHYDSLEGFIEFCGDGIRAATVEMPQYGFDIIYLFDHREEGPLPADFWTPEDWKVFKEDGEKPDGIGGNFCYAINTLDGMMSEWGYAPFPQAGQTEEEHYNAWADNLRAFADAIGGDMAVVDSLNPEIKTLDDMLEAYKP